MAKRKEDFWKRHFKEWEKSGKTKAAYCKEQGISYWSFGAWRTRLNKKSATAPFVQIALPEFFDSSAKPSALVLVTKNKYRIEINDRFNPAVLTALVKTLEEAASPLIREEKDVSSSCAY